ncbi:hypothetical protein [Actinopolymorpha singaporensis]|uniref:Uncharacterized protein n=1 Tax=Actinopolymorpha singaporensis TaxID=117157 RepID=A0A1H1TB14_9ACTN|nr:hypothetical protein [Actinopolymorpha singaporensis]SDR90739.1 hypothetical protein SAMN04489717_0983 [Actinopolymorpha singaporensis]SDS57324.1 hypothetical protein SAMN04489717_3125 [Actinopolymorpha singaporensis]
MSDATYNQSPEDPYRDPMTPQDTPADAPNGADHEFTTNTNGLADEPAEEPEAESDDDIDDLDDIAGLSWALRQMLLRGYRLMAVYEHLRQAVDWMAAELKVQEQVLNDAREFDADMDCRQGEAVFKDATAMTATIAGERDRAAEVVCAIFGQNAFKTGQVHKTFYKAQAALDDIAKATASDIHGGGDDAA